MFLFDFVSGLNICQCYRICVLGKVHGHGTLQLAEDMQIPCLTRVVKCVGQVEHLRAGDICKY